MFVPSKSMLSLCLVNYRIGTGVLEGCLFKMGISPTVLWNSSKWLDGCWCAVLDKSSMETKLNRGDCSSWIPLTIIRSGHSALLKHRAPLVRWEQEWDNHASTHVGVILIDSSHWHRDGGTSGAGTYVSLSFSWDCLSVSNNSIECWNYSNQYHINQNK